MNSKTQKNYGGLDTFRLAAALFVVAIHTSPLASISGDADFFLTRVLARVAVPFFFMVTGHFVLSELFDAPPNGISRKRPLLPARLKKYLLRLCLLYGVSILAYLPLGIYAGHYQELSPGALLRMLLFDGTFYHLWYFPACILGVLLVFLLSRFLRLEHVSIFSAVLYVIGLFGDSYFGLAEKLPALEAMYSAMFRVFSYTRNGLFLAPLFLVLGIWAGVGFAPAAADSSTCRRKAAALCAGLFLSFCAVTAEAFILRHFSLQRHDSMYFFLVPVLFLLYRCLLLAPAPSKKSLRTMSAWIYVLHPAFIVVIRGAAKLLHLTTLFVDNSVLHYLAVCSLSVGAGFALVRLTSRIPRGRLTGSRSRSAAEHNLPRACLADPHGIRSCKRPAYPGAEDFAGDHAPDALFCQAKTERAWIELDLRALEHNVRFLQSCLPEGCRLMPAVKADAYGHGAIHIAGELNRLGIRDFCVACVSEGIRLREAGITGQILILGYTHPGQFPLLQRYRLTQTVIDPEYAELLEQSGQKLHVHIAVDTGMHRLGIRCEDIEQIAAVYKMKNLSVDGIFTHLSACDSDAPNCRDFTESQISAFYQVTDILKAMGCACGSLHLLSSYGILNYPEAAADLVRPGIALYGVLSSRNELLSAALRPVLSLKARVASVRTLQPGESAGYGMDFTAKRETRIAVLSIGYADGFPRSLSSRGGYVLIRGKKAPVIGRVCMDQTLVDVSRIPEVKGSDIAVLIGASGSARITVEELAERCGTISNEILSRLGARLERIPAAKD